MLSRVLFWLCSRVAAQLLAGAEELSFPEHYYSVFCAAAGCYGMNFILDVYVHRDSLAKAMNCLICISEGAKPLNCVID